ncbi:MAG TPA: S8 family serine peptidase, partial [Actinomycetota bacterium]|nr:S8 family serine peptidase [Actinomycetota bacterium]
FPGTKIVGGITFEEPGEIPCENPEPRAGGRILDASGHGTMTASRATATEYGACKECLVVAVQFPTSLPIGPGMSDTTQPAIDAIRWAAANSDWIDAQSNSWGPFVPAWDPTGQAGLFTANPELVKAVEEVSQKHLALWASGNGALFRFGVVGHPTLLSPHLGPSAVIVGGHDSGYVTTWPGFPPHVVSDACASWAAYHTKNKKSAENVGGGTSAATPFVAGGAARILLEARRLLGETDTGVTGGVVAAGPKGLVDDGPLSDGTFTVEEWKETVFKTASPRPEATHEDGPTCPIDADTARYAPTPIRWSDVPSQYPEYLHIGYGAVDGDAMKLAFGVLLGKVAMPDRAATDQYFALDKQARQTTYAVFSAP